jgi:UTP--glucose-1-phosphate uridylyltransferase
VQIKPFKWLYPYFIFSWYPPGHGDFYQSFKDSGLLERLESKGRKYIFVSNIDNMAGTADLNILNKIVEQNSEFVLEVTNKTRADVKGTCLFWSEGNYRLLEMHKVPKERKWMEIINQKTMFNTNNVWLSMSGKRGMRSLRVRFKFHIFSHQKGSGTRCQGA